MIKYVKNVHSMELKLFGMEANRLQKQLIYVNLMINYYITVILTEQLILTLLSQMVIFYPMMFWKN